MTLILLAVSIPSATVVERIRLVAEDADWRTDMLRCDTPEEVARRLPEIHIDADRLSMD